ncbi:MAG: hypothetical protein ACWGQW_05430 [bacterium]
MQYIGAFIKMLPSGRGYKAYLWGQPDMHIMDWNGCNHRRFTIPDQPLFGFQTPEKAADFVRAKYPTEDDLKRYADKCGDGSFLTEEFFADNIEVRWDGKKKAAKVRD